MPDSRARTDLHRVIDVGAFVNDYAIVLPVGLQLGAGRNQRLGLPVVDRTLGRLENAQHAQAFGAVGTGPRARAHAVEEMAAFFKQAVHAADRGKKIDHVKTDHA